MGKSKTSVDDMLAFLDEEESDNSSSIWRPQRCQNKVSTNLVQTENKVETGASAPKKTLTVSQPSPNRELTVSQPLADPSPNRELTVSQPLVGKPKKKPKKTQPLATPLADPSPNRELTVSQPLAENLTGKKRTFIFWLFKIRHSTGEEETGPIDNKTLFELLNNRSTGALRNLLNQLKASGYVSIYPLTKGRIGLRKFKLNDSVYKEILSLPEEVKSLTVSQPSPNRELTVSQPLATALVSAPSSSSYLKIKSTSTSDELWKTLDLSFVEKMGINQSAVFEAQQKFGPFDFVDFEKFLERFSKYMADSKKSRNIGNARGFFFSLCKQMREGIEPLSEVETDGDMALKNLLEEKKKAKAERDKLKRELIEFEFEEWFEGLTEEDKKEISPENPLIKKNSEPYKAIFRSYFEGNVWAQK